MSYYFLVNKSPQCILTNSAKQRIAVIPRKSREIMPELIVPLEHLLGVRASWVFRVFPDFHLYPISDVKCLSICSQKTHSSVGYSKLNVHILVWFLRNS